MGRHHWSEFQILHHHLLTQRGSSSDHVPEMRRACKNWWSTRWQSCSHTSTPPQGCNPTRGRRACRGGRPAWSPARPHLSHTFFRASKERAFSRERRDLRLRRLKNCKKKNSFSLEQNLRNLSKSQFEWVKRWNSCLFSSAIYLCKWGPCYNFLWFLSINTNT